jgi:isopentenyldiphosphate isomerase
MDEWVDIVDTSGVPTGEKCLKSEAHKQGYWHPCVNIWLYNSKGEILIQKRVADKDTFPNLWDVSVAGHIGAGEFPLEAAQRELTEELGLDIPTQEFNFIGTYNSDHSHNEKLIDREFHHVYLVELKVPMDQLKLQTEEVAGIKMISLADATHVWFDAELKQDYVPYTTDYFKMVCKAIYQRIN